MRRIINGKIYDTATAECLCELSSPPRSESGWHDTCLFRTKKGQFFLAGEGYAHSMWAQPWGNTDSQPGEGLRLIDEEEAQNILEQEDEHEILERLFAIEEG